MNFCEDCHTELDGLGMAAVEAFEITGKLLCDDCAEQALENAPFEEKDE